MLSCLSAIKAYFNLKQNIDPLHEQNNFILPFTVVSMKLVY